VSAARKTILLLWFVVTSLATASALTPGATETRVGQKSFAPLESRQAEPFQTAGLHQENPGCGYDVAPESLLAAKTGVQDATYLYQKVGAQGEHLKFGITKNPATRYTQEELAGGRLRIIGQGERSEMLRLERQLHETLPIGPEEAQKFYIQKQIEKGLKPPPYNP
jgi:hypothetical protein